MSDGSIIIDTMLDSKELEKGINSLGDVAKKGLKVFTGAVALAGGALTGLGIKAIGLASDLEEVQNVVDVTFGDNADKINKWAKDAAKSFGMSELQAKKFNGTMGAMLKSMGLSGDQVYDLSTSMTGLAADFASFYNLSHEEAFDKIRAGISGETEPLKQLGINMSVANLEAFALSQGINKAYNEMTQAEQATLRYNYLMSAGADAQGDFARTSDSLANQMRIAKLNMESLSADIGKLLLPIAQEAVKSFNDVGGQLREAFNDPNVQGSIVSIAEGIGGLIKNVADFVVEWLPKIIDGLAWMMDHSSEIAAGIIGIGVAMMTMNVANMILGVVEAFKKAKRATEGLTLAQWLMNAAMSANPIGIVVALIAGLVAAFIYLWNTNEDFRNFFIKCWENIKQFFEDCWNGIMTFFTETIPAWIDSVIAWFEGIPQWFSELPGKIGYAVGYALAVIVQWGIDCWNWVTTEIPKIIDGIIKWFSKLPSKIWNWLCDTVDNIIKWGANMYNSACQAASDTVEGIVDWFMDLPSNMLNVGKNLVTGLWNGIIGAKDWLLDKIGDFCSGVMDGFLGFFDIHSPSRLFRDLIGTNLVKGIGVGIDVETPNLEKDINANMAELTAKLKGTVDYETAKTTAGVVAKQNFIVGSGTDDKTQERHTEPKIVVDNHVYIDGKECMQTLAPHQEVWEKWNEGR